LVLGVSFRPSTKHQTPNTSAREGADRSGSAAVALWPCSGTPTATPARSLARSPCNFFPNCRLLKRSGAVGLADHLVYPRCAARGSHNLEKAEFPTRELGVSVFRPVRRGLRAASGRRAGFDPDRDLPGRRQLNGVHPAQQPVQLPDGLVDVLGLHDQGRRHQDQAAARHHVEALVPGPPADLQGQR